MEHAIVAVIGAGTMGSAMVRRLLGQGHPVWVWNRDPEPLRALAAAGAEVTSDSRRAVSGAPVVLAVLPTAAAVTEVILDGGVLEGMEQEAVLAQMGTIGVAATLSLDAAVRDRRPDVMFVDVPVSGSKAPAERGELLLLGSGPGEAADALGPVLSALGRRTLWLGPAGAGSRMKLVLNTWLAFEVEAVAEVSALAVGLGISGTTLASAIAGSPLVSPYAAAKLAKMQAQDDNAEFSLQWALKDLDLVAEAAPRWVHAGGERHRRSLAGVRG